MLFYLDFDFFEYDNVNKMGTPWKLSKLNLLLRTSLFLFFSHTLQIY